MDVKPDLGEESALLNSRSIWLISADDHKLYVFFTAGLSRSSQSRFIARGP